MTIFLNNLKRIFTKKSNFIIMFVVPIAFIVMISASMNSQSSSKGLDIGFVDNDNTKLTRMLEKSLEQKGNIHVVSKKDIRDMIINKKIDTAVVISKGFTQKILDNKNEKDINMYEMKGVSNDSSIKYFINSFVNASENISKASKGDHTKFYNGIKDYEKGNFTSAVSYSDGKKLKVEASTESIGYLVMSMLYLSSMITIIILKDKESGVYKRILANGIKKSQYMFQNIASFIFVLMFQTLVILLIMKNIVHSDLGPSIFNLFVVLSVFGVACVALGVAISSLSKNLRQANAALGFITTPIAMIGGCFWPRDIMSTTLKNISNFVPPTWALEAAQKVISGSSIVDVSKELSIVVIFAIVFFIISSLRKFEVE